MAVLTFKGGIYPERNSKTVAREQFISEFTDVSTLTYFLGEDEDEASPVVVPGQLVRKYDLIAERADDNNANVHTAISGTVRDVKYITNNFGNKELAIIIDRQDNDVFTEERNIRRDYKKLSYDEIVNIIGELGVTGLGGGAFPVDTRLKWCRDNDIKTVVINACESEPYITAGYRILYETPEVIAGGIEILRHLFKDAEIIIAIESDKKSAYKDIKKHINGIRKVKAKVVYSKYPQGFERILIKTICGIELSSGELPEEQGIVVFNVATMQAIYDAVVFNKPLVDNVVTLNGDAYGMVHNIRTYFGTCFDDLLSFAGGFEFGPELLLSGGPMQGTRLLQNTRDIYTTKETTAFVAFKNDPVKKLKKYPCVGCGKCSLVCPIHLLPYRIAEYARLDDKKEFMLHYGDECIGCGCCSFVCPAAADPMMTIVSKQISYRN